MQVTKIAATTRNDHGKGASRRLRVAGRLPVISYGKGVPTRSLIVDPADVVKVLTSKLGVNTVVDLDVEGERVHAMISSYQYHPLSRRLLHADFIEVKDDQTVDVQVPLVLTGKSKGIVMGGKLVVVFRELPVRCVPSAIPAEITHDISELDVDDSLHVSDLILPAGVSVLIPAKQTVATIAMDRRAKGEEDAPAPGTAGAASPSK